MESSIDRPEAAGRQSGVFTRAQALAEGWSRHQVDRRLNSKRWVRVCGDALGASGLPRTATVLAWGAFLTWPDAVVSHLTAAGLHGFPVVSVPHAHVTLLGGQARSRPAIVRHRLPLSAEDVLRPQRQPPRTSRRRTGIDCLRLLPYDEARSLLTWLMTRDVVGHEDLQCEIDRSPRRWGNQQLRRLLEVTRGGALSEAEHKAHALLRRYGLTGWEANVPLMLPGGGAVIVDILFREAMLVVEIDGFGAHSGREAFVRDRRRQNDLVSAGYRVLRFTWEDLVDRPGQVARTIRAELAKAGVA